MNEDFDNNLKNLFSDFQQKPNDDVWEKLSAKIPPKKKKRGFFWLFFPAIIFASAFTYFIFTKNPLKENKNFTSINNPEKTVIQTKPETEQNTAIKLLETETGLSSNSTTAPKPENVSKFSTEIIAKKSIQKKKDDLNTSSNFSKNEKLDVNPQNTNLSNTNHLAENNVTEALKTETQVSISENLLAKSNTVENTETIKQQELTESPISETENQSIVSENTIDATENSQKETIEQKDCQWFAPKCWKIKPELNENGKKLTFAFSIGANTNQLSTKEKKQNIEMKQEMVLGYSANLHLQLFSRFKLSAGLGVQNYFEKGSAVITTTGIYDNKFNYQLNTVYENPILISTEIAQKLGLPYDTTSGKPPSIPSNLTEGSLKKDWDTAVVVNFENQIKTLVLPFSLVYEIRIGKIGIPIGGNLAFNVIQQQQNSLHHNNQSFELNQKFNKKLFIGSGFTTGIAFYFTHNQSINFQYNLQKLNQSFQFKEGKNKHHNQQFGINYLYTF